MRTNKSTNKEPLSWLKDQPKLRQNIINHFNSHLDTLVEQQDLLKFDNSDNTLSDIIRTILPMAAVAIAPGQDSNSKDIEYYNSILQYEADLVKLTESYCKNKFKNVTL